MTQIKKFAWGSVAASLFAVMAFATLVNTSYAEVIAVDVTGASSIAVGATTTFTVETDADDAVVINLHPSSTGSVTLSHGDVTGATSLLLPIDDDVSSEITARGVTPGIVIVQAQAVGTEQPTVTAVITVTGAPTTLGSIVLTTPGSIASEGEADATVRTLTADGAAAVSQDVTVIIGGAGLLAVDGTGECVAIDDMTTTADECEVTTGGATPTADAGRATIGVVALDADSGDEISLLAFSGVRSTSASITIGAAADALTVSAPAIVGAGATAEISVDVVDEDGNAVPDGTAVQVAASAGVVFGCSNTVGGTATCSYTAPSVQQTVTVIASVGTITGTTTLSVGAGTTPPVGDGSFTGTIADSGVSIVSFDGGSVADLAAAAAAEGLTSVWLTVDGEMVGYIVGAPAFVNAAFNAQFAAGLAEGTLAIVVK